MLAGIWLAACGSRSLAENPDHRPGLIVVAKVVGQVEATRDQGKTTQRLKKSDTLSETYTVMVGAASSVTLAFSNGAIISLLENTTMVISQFLQDPFSYPFASSELSQEPTTSTTKLQLVKGQMVGQVKKLKTEQGSSLIVNTPVGAAGVRGTTFAVSYIPDPTGNGLATYTLSVTEGSVEFIDHQGNKRLISAGQEIVIRFRQTTDPVTGRVTVVEILDITIRDIPIDQKNLIGRIEFDGSESSELIFADLLDQQGVQLNLPQVPVLNGVKPPQTTLVDP